jgi:hypothetical protein
MGLFYICNGEIRPFDQKHLPVKSDAPTLFGIQAVYSPPKFGAKGHILSVTYITCLVL